jgi:hypothetical protein
MCQTLWTGADRDPALMGFPVKKGNVQLLENSLSQKSFKKSLLIIVNSHHVLRAYWVRSLTILISWSLHNSQTNMVKSWSRSHNWWAVARIQFRSICWQKQSPVCPTPCLIGAGSCHIEISTHMIYPIGSSNAPCHQHHHPNTPHFTSQGASPGSQSHVLIPLSWNPLTLLCWPLSLHIQFFVFSFFVLCSLKKLDIGCLVLSLAEQNLVKSRLFFFFFFSTGAWNQAMWMVGKCPYHLSYIPSQSLLWKAQEMFVDLNERVNNIMYMKSVFTVLGMISSSSFHSFSLITH